MAKGKVGHTPTPPLSVRKENTRLKLRIIAAEVLTRLKYKATSNATVLKPGN
jgi:hypothetical protein